MPTPKQTRTGLTRDETRESLRRFNLSASLRTVFETVCGGTTFVFVGFARSLGVRSERMGWMTSIISFACILQMIGIPFVGRAKNKKRLALTLAITEPLLVIAAVILALLLPPGFRIVAFASAVFAAAAFVHLSRPLTDDWFAATIPAAIRGRFLGRRLQIVSAVVITTTLTLGFLAQRMGMTNRIGLGCLLMAGAAAGVAAVLALREARMPALAANSAPRLGDFKRVLQTPFFMRLMAVNVLYNIPFFFACPYYQVFNLEIAAMPAIMIAVMQAGYYAVKIVSLPYLGRLVDRWGPRRTMYRSGVVYALFFATFLVCGPGRFWPIMLGWAFVALADGAFGLAATTALYASVPENPARPAYFAVANFVAVAFLGVGGAVAVPILEAIKTVHIRVGPFTLGNFHLLYGACALAMIPCLLAARLIPNELPDRARPPTAQDHA